MSKDLFSLYSENMKILEDIIEAMIEGLNINNIRYEEDTVLIADSELDLQNLV